jgi:hypothetical protein
VIGFCSILVIDDDDDDEKKEISTTKTTNGKSNTKDHRLVTGFCIEIGFIAVVVVVVVD